ncbi:MAG: hypothetical protein P4L31_04735 [Candidatus Babeliales bacterium]|nr:hypothetical protein [Candidatus Babeliales bacterium]
MKISLKNHLMSNIVLKTISLLLGYAVWSILTTSHIATRWVDIPLAFYGDTTNNIEAPEMITVALQAKRTDLRAIDTKTLAAHINATQLHVGPNLISLDNKTLFLPDSIKLVHYSPINLVINLHENQSLT